jgi:hypothetical protein
MTNFPCMTRSLSAAGETRFTLGDPLVDSYLEFVGGRARPNTLRAVVLDRRFRGAGFLPPLVPTAQLHRRAEMLDL